jgi:gentisate 1,2-dioxygenase
MEEALHPITKPDESSSVEFGRSMAPSSRRSQAVGHNSPIINYKYSDASQVLGSMVRHEDIDPHRGHVLDYLNPLTGGWAMSTLATTMRRLPRGFETQPYRSTDTTVSVVVEGEGTSRIGGEEFHWGPNDILVAPSWTEQEHLAATEATIFTYSDRASQEKLGIWREGRGR